MEEVERLIFASNGAVEVPQCPRCRGLVKPNITFFGENLPEAFFKAIPKLKAADVLLVLGTSLCVNPFASLVHQVSKACPRVLFNRERVGPFVAEDEPRNVFVGGDCDEGVLQLVRLLGWEEEFQDVIRRGRKEFQASKEKREAAQEKVEIEAKSESAEKTKQDGGGAEEETD